MRAWSQLDQQLSRFSNEYPRKSLTRVFKYLSNSFKIFGHSVIALQTDLQNFRAWPYYSANRRGLIAVAFLMTNKTHSFSLRFVTGKDSDEIVNVIFDSLRHFFETLTSFLSLFRNGIDKIIDFETLSSWQLDDFKLRNLFQYSVNSLFLDIFESEYLKI